MAKPKQSVLVKTYDSNSIDVWIDDPSQVIGDILQVEGVSSAKLSIASKSIIYLLLDPRYDKEEIASEIRVLLSSEVPEMFQRFLRTRSLRNSTNP